MHRYIVLIRGPLWLAFLRKRLKSKWRAYHSNSKLLTRKETRGVEWTSENAKIVRRTFIHTYFGGRLTFFQIAALYVVYFLPSLMYILYRLSRLNIHWFLSLEPPFWMKTLWTLWANVDCNYIKCRSSMCYYQQFFSAISTSTDVLRYTKRGIHSIFRFHLHSVGNKTTGKFEKSLLDVIDIRGINNIFEKSCLYDENLDSSMLLLAAGISLEKYPPLNNSLQVTFTPSIFTALSLDENFWKDSSRIMWPSFLEILCRCASAASGCCERLGVCQYMYKMKFVFQLISNASWIFEGLPTSSRAMDEIWTCNFHYWVHVVGMEFKSNSLVQSKHFTTT